MPSFRTRPTSISPAGGDHDYNDMIVQLDFTGASDHGWLA
jgi:hypothetical protein